jgi:hypothetical protein
MRNSTAARQPHHGSPSGLILASLRSRSEGCCVCHANTPNHLRHTLAGQLMCSTLDTPFHPAGCAEGHPLHLCIQFYPSNTGLHSSRDLPGTQLCRAIHSIAQARCLPAHGCSGTLAGPQGHKNFLLLKSEPTRGGPTPSPKMHSTRMHGRCSRHTAAAPSMVTSGMYRSGLTVAHPRGEINPATVYGHVPDIWRASHLDYPTLLL